MTLTKAQLKAVREIQSRPVEMDGKCECKQGTNYVLGTGKGEFLPLRTYGCHYHMDGDVEVESTPGIRMRFTKLEFFRYFNAL